jgi:hypothetical protein
LRDLAAAADRIDWIRRHVFQHWREFITLLGGTAAWPLVARA